MSLSMKTELFVWRANIFSLYLKVTPMIWFPAATQADELEVSSSSSSHPVRLLHLSGQVVTTQLSGEQRGYFQTGDAGIL